METNSQHFIKIEIKGESDLPEKGKRYFFHKKGTSILRLQTYCPKDDNCEVLPKYYLDDYDFYLSPVPEPQQPEQPESAELSTRSYPSICSHCEGKGYIQPIQGQITTTAWSNVCPVCNGSKVIIITETFASQSPSKAVIMPTEEDSENVACEWIAKINKTPGLDMPLVKTFIEACKWFRSHVREVELKGELERIIIDFINGRFKTILFSTASKKEVAKLIVDDYLSARKEGE